jgi:hypothetical protein
VNSTIKMAFSATALVVASIACGPAAVAPSAAVVSLPPQPGPSLQAATAAPTPTPNLLDTSTWTTYVSKRYGFGIAHPADWNEDPSTHVWTLANDGADPLNGGPEHFSGGSEGQGVGVSVWSAAVAPGTSVESWLGAYCQKNSVDCTGIMDTAVDLTMDGHPGSLVQWTGIPFGLFLVDGRMYVIACWLADDDPTVLKYSGSKRLVQAFVSTMDLLPGGPAPSATTPPPS